MCTLEVSFPEQHALKCVIMCACPYKSTSASIETIGGYCISLLILKTCLLEIAIHYVAHNNQQPVDSLSALSLSLSLSLARSVCVCACALATRGHESAVQAAPLDNQPPPAAYLFFYDIYGNERGFTLATTSYRHRAYAKTLYPARSTVAELENGGTSTASSSDYEYSYS
eukprot:scaffold313699_cov19-Prasinocladus_malaysianus.AAC.1